MSTHRAHRNLSLFPWYVGAVSTYAWMPVFFLYLASRVTVAEVLALEAIYYAAVVLLEVPSGYFSDRVGRRPTLVIAASALVASYVGFAASDSFLGLAVAQALLAVGLAFNSGTDTSMHYASLAAAGLSQEFAQREARLASMTFTVGAVSAVAGGAAGALDLRLPYVISGVAAMVALAAALGMKEVDDSSLSGASPPGGFGGALRACGRLVRAAPLAWLFGASVVGTVLNHVPYELYQPYLARLPALPWGNTSTPLLAGLHVAAAWMLAAPVARRSAALRERWGMAALVLVAMGIQVALIGLMAAWLHPVVAVLLLGRTLPRAMLDAPMNAAVAPRVPGPLRATYLSLQSLAGRLGFSVLLFMMSLATGSAAAESLQTPMLLAAVVSAGLWLALAAGAWRGKQD